VKKKGGTLFQKQIDVVQGAHKKIKSRIAAGRGKIRAKKKEAELACGAHLFRRASVW